MTELLVSEITRMSRGYCVIGLERSGEHFCSLRPLPRWGYAWTRFPYRRADKVAFDFSVSLAVPPHTEDRSAANDHKVGFVSESELVRCLKKAEVATCIKGLFGCDAYMSRHGGEAVYVLPEEAERSICGCEIESIRFSFHFYPKIRAALALKSGETLESLPLVDAEWTEFINLLAERFKDQAHSRLQLEELLDSLVCQQINSSAVRFVRIGLSRPDRDGLCWLMLDSLFPLPKKAWLESINCAPVSGSLGV